MRACSLGLAAFLSCASLAFGGEGDVRQTGTRLNRAPLSAHGKANPYAGSADAARAGRKLFERHCAECHGAAAGGGRGGPALDTRRVDAAPAGDLFWFLTNGNRRVGMPSWSRFPNAQRWQIVEFLKTLATSGGK